MYTFKKHEGEDVSLEILNSSISGMHNFLLQHDLLCNFQYAAFSFDQRFDMHHPEGFLNELVNSDSWRENIKASRGYELFTILEDSVTGVDFTKLSTTHTNMDFFNILFNEDSEVIRENTGKIVKCVPQFLDSITFYDTLRCLLWLEEDENYCLFDENERQEFIFDLFRFFATGGALCQPDEGVERYFDFTKKTYRDLLTVVKKDGKLQIVNH
ncbi:hypothetical protein PCE1_002230, partial [Barthelona sp. PCE]